MALDKEKTKVGSVIKLNASHCEKGGSKLWRGEIVQIEDGKFFYKQIVTGNGAVSSSERSWCLSKWDLGVLDLVYDFDLNTAPEMKPTNLKSASDYMKEMNDVS